MVPLVAAGLIAAGAGAASSVGNAAMQSASNKRERQHQEYMYWLQRNNNVADWHMQNEYNSPAQQMARLKAAGLNPNLVYGNGSTSTGTASPVPEASAPSASFVAPKLDTSFAQTAMSSYFNIEQQRAQTNNLQQQTAVIQEEARLKAAQTLSTLMSTRGLEFDLGIKSELRDYTIEQARESLRKLRGEADVSLGENNRRELSNTMSLKEAATRILQMRAQTANTQADRRRIEEQIKQIKASTTNTELDNNLKSMGINPGDPQWQRMLGQAIGGKDGMVDKAKSAWDGIKKTWKKWTK